MENKVTEKFITWGSLFFGIISFITGMLLLLTSTYAPSQELEGDQKISSSRAGTGEVISHREIMLKPGVNIAEFEKWAVEYFNPALESLIPGIRAYVAKAVRGVRNGKYAYIFHYDSYNTRQAYIPETDKATKYFSKIFFEPNKHLFDELFEHIDQNSFNQFTKRVELR